MDGKNTAEQVVTTGKHEIIDIIKNKTIIKNPETFFGIGDDAAVCNFAGDEKTVISTDMFAEGIHFDLTYTPLKHLGYKVVVAGISDIYAMNAIPVQITVGLAISKRFGVAQIEEIYDGVASACEFYGVDLIGGDLTSSLTGICISVTSIGKANAEDIVYRHGAKPTDLLCVTGDLGAAYIGLQLLEREKAVFEGNPNKQPQLDGYDYILRRQLKPETHKNLLTFFKKKDIKPTSMTDISAGLASEIISICKESSLGCEIFEERLPIAEETEKMCREFNIPPVVAALNGGEDYEMLFTIALKNYEKIKDNKLFSIIGSINAADKGTNIVTRDGSILPLDQNSNLAMYENI